jgi:serine protease inhibitor
VLSLNNTKLFNRSDVFLVFELFHSSLRSTENSGSNLFFSPLSIALALAMLREGARGESSRELSALLGVPSASDLRSSSLTLHHRLQTLAQSGLALAVANAVFLQRDYKVTRHSYCIR